MSEAKIAIAAVVTMAAMAGTGSMKKVIGTSIAVAIVADRPGTAPTKRPKAEQASITKAMFQVSTRGSASEIWPSIRASPSAFRLAAAHAEAV